MEFVHKSIMLEEVIESLAIKPNGIYVDGTLGGAGHSSEIVKRLGEDGRLIGIDQDGEAIEAATKRLKPYKDKVTIVRSNYAQMKEVLRDLGIPKVDGILLDLGVSSYQLDNAERGFTYREDVPLDMRMDQRQTKTARWSCIILSVITGRTSLQRISQSILSRQDRRLRLRQQVS